MSSYRWDAGDRMVREENGLANGDTKLVTVLTYDSLNHLTRKTLQKEQGGQVVEVQDASNYTYQPQMDASLLATANNGVANLSFDYDLAPPFANLAFEMRAADPANPLSLIQDRYAVARDASGEISGIVAASSGATLLSAEHDPAGRLSKLTGVLGGQSLTSTLKYDTLGRKRSVTSSTGMIGSFSWDNLNRPTNTYWNGLDGVQSQNFSEQLTWDPLKDVITNSQREFGTFSYSFDPIDQLKSVTYSGIANLPAQFVNRTLAFDYAGNRVSDSLNGPGQFIANILLSDGSATYRPDPYGLGNLALKADRATGVTQHFIHNVEGKLSRFESSTVSADYAFDALGRRVSKSIQMGSNTFTQSYLYLGDSNQVLLGKSGNSDVTLYLDGQAPNEHLAEVSASGVKAYLTDHLGSVVNSVAAGGVATYSPWGENLGLAPELTAASSALVYGWQGMEHDLASGLEFTPARTESTQTNRWDEPDPIWPADHANPYVPDQNNPLLYTDPSGLASCTYDVRSHTMVCVSSTGQTFSSSNFVSGMGGPAQNNPDFSNVPFIGPIQPGTYNIGPQRPNSTRRPLTPVPNSTPIYPTPTRPAFQTHGCSNKSTCSQGCVASPSISVFNNFLNNDPAPSTVTVK